MTSAMLSTRLGKAPVESRQPTRLSGLDSLRGIAALSVVLYHYTSGYGTFIGPHSQPVVGFKIGQLGVELFFVISGFVIAWTLERSASLGDFAVNRFARLYPPYVAGLMLTGVVMFGFGFNPAHVTPGAAMLNLIMGLNQLIGLPNVDPSYWTLGVELSFYAMASIVTFVLPMRLELFCLPWLAVSLLIRHLLPDTLRLHLLVGADFSGMFVAGAMLFALMRHKRADMLTWATFLAALLTCVISQGDPSRLVSKTTNTIMVFLFIGAVYVAATGRVRALELRPLVAMGRASYSLYLIHQLIGYWIITGLERAGIPAYAAITVAVVAAVTLAFALRALVEQPVQAMIKRAAGARGLGKSASLGLSGERATSGETARTA